MSGHSMPGPGVPARIFGKDAGFPVKVPKLHINYQITVAAVPVHSYLPRETTQRNEKCQPGHFPGWFLVAGKRPTPELQYS